MSMSGNMPQQIGVESMTYYLIISNIKKGYIKRIGKYPSLKAAKIAATKRHCPYNCSMWIGEYEKNVLKNTYDI